MADFETSLHFSIMFIIFGVIIATMVVVGFDRIILLNVRKMEVTDKNYSELVAKGDLLVLDFWATWCGPCMALAPTMEQIEKDYAGKPVVVGKVNVDENEDLTDKFSIRNVPTILFIKNGEVVDKCVGAVLKNVITEKINALI